LGVNAGIITAHENGIVTSASLMVHWPAAREAASYARQHPGLDLGLHVDLEEWAYRTSGWELLYRRVDVEDRMAVEHEIWNQFELFCELTGSKPTHLDSHQHVHLLERLRPVFVDIARELSVPLRHCTPWVRYCGDFYGQTAEGGLLTDAISVDRLLHILGTLPSGLTELGCHPGQVDDLETMYRAERAHEVQTLCDPRIRAAIRNHGIRLCTLVGSGWVQSRRGSTDGSEPVKLEAEF
jgi:predicted glycoside hydrolase/deacetylase ChbG (UPF0249 family)